ncbi:MAG: DUF3418 domain-containing protein [Nocardioides sp.]
MLAYERVTLYGVPLVADRLVGYGAVDPALARGAVHPALVYGGRDTRHALPREPPAARRGRGSWSTGPGAGTWSTSTRSSTSTTPAWAPTW